MNSRGRGAGKQPDAESELPVYTALIEKEPRGGNPYSVNPPSSCSSNMHSEYMNVGYLTFRKLTAFQKTTKRGQPESLLPSFNHPLPRSPPSLKAVRVTQHLLNQLRFPGSDSK